MKWRWKMAQAAEIRWWQNYLSKKEPTEYLNWKKKYWRNFLKTCNIEPQEGQRCLDAGCGPAGVFTVLDTQQVVAVDPLLTQYQEKLPHFVPQDYPFTSFITSSIEDFTPTSSFDFVFCLNAINHVDDIDKSVDRLLQALAPTGTLVFSIDAHNYQGFKRLFRLLPGDILHPHQYDLSEYENMLTSRGLKIINAHQIDKAFFFDYYVLLAQWR